MRECMEPQSEGSRGTKACCAGSKEIREPRCRNFLVNNLHFSEIRQVRVHAAQ